MVVATSAGPDSTALLHILHSLEMGLELVAVYVDHGLRPHEIGTEKDFLNRLVLQLGVDLICRSVDVLGFARESGRCIEESARILRYKLLEEIRQERGAAVIAVGHTADDQVEEFFLRLIRGTGLKGLAGMAWRHGRVIRPLLDLPKASLVSYLQEIGIVSCQDSSNQSRDYLRNRVRLDLLPHLGQLNPSIASTVRQTMDILKEEEEYLEQAATLALATIRTGSETAGTAPSTLTLLRQPFLALHTAIQRRVLEKTCWSMDVRPSWRIIRELQDLIRGGSRDAQRHLSMGLRVRITGQTVLFSYPAGRDARRGDKEPELYHYIIERPGKTYMPELGKTLILTSLSKTGQEQHAKEILAVDEERIAYPLHLRPVEPGEMMRPLGAPGRKKINRILSDMKIPASEKHAYPLLVDAHGPVAVIGARIAERVKITGETSRVLSIRLVDI